MSERQPGTMERHPSNEAQVGSATVRRALPQRGRRTVGAWCFVDHFGPTSGTDGGLRIGAHPHIGLHTVTWLVEGTGVHSDSLGSEQLLRPGQLNVMTAGHGIAHAEDTPANRHATMHGAQLWVAQPEATRHGPAAFEHHADLPQVRCGAVDLTVMIGELAGHRSPARADTALFGAEFRSHGSTGAVPLRADHEYAVVVLDGAAEIDGARVTPGELAFLDRGRDELDIGGTATGLLLGGEPFPDRPLMWWNFVGRSWQEIADARDAWASGHDERFGPVDTRLGTVPAPALPPFATPTKGSPHE